MQFVSLEATCVEYLSDQAQHMKANGLLCLAQLADRLGLSPLLDTAAEHLIVLPWQNNILLMSSLLRLSVYTADTDKRTKLLHHPKRGAFTELQVLAVLETMDIPRADCASALELHRLQRAELHCLIAALVDSEEDPGELLRAAKLQLVPKALRTAPDWSKNIRIVHKVMMPDPGSFQIHYIALPECELKLGVQRRSVKGRAVC